LGRDREQNVVVGKYDAKGSEDDGEQNREDGAEYKIEEDGEDGNVDGDEGENSSAPNIQRSSTTTRARPYICPGDTPGRIVFG